MEVNLYAKLPDKQRCWVAQIHDLRCLDEEERAAAQAAFEERGWLAAMQAHVAAVGGDPAVILNTPYAGHYLNVRYRPENVQRMPPHTLLPEGFLAGHSGLL